MIFEMERLGLRAFWRGDWELRVGRCALTILYNGFGDGGVFLLFGRREWYWAWPGNTTRRPVSRSEHAAVG